MSVIVKGGGGKPEEEKTVTAGTSVIEVNPSSGKVMKKVTVNPTPTESKSVTPTTSELTVTPSEGKHLSQVVVGAVEDVTPEVTAQTPVITQIAENLGVTITTPSGTNKQILHGNNANLLNIKNNAKKEGAYVWKKSYGILPSEYKIVEYIASSGTQFIDTGFKPNNNTCYEIKYQTVPTQNYAGIMGAEHDWSNTSFALWCKHAGFANSTISNQTWYGASPVTIRFDKGTLYKDGVQVWSASGTFQCNYNAYLFGINRAGTLTEPVDNLKIYYVKIWDNGTLVRDFVPCTKNGIAGLYDRVNNDFYVNKGSGTFSVGEVISEATNIEYVVSDEPSKYPDDGTMDGYWYKNVVGIDVILSLFGSTKYSVDKIIPASNISKPFNHTLGEIPKYALLRANGHSASTDSYWEIIEGFGSNIEVNVGYLTMYTGYNGGQYAYNSYAPHMTENTIDFGGTRAMAGIEYTLITMA